MSSNAHSIIFLIVPITDLRKPYYSSVKSCLLGQMWWSAITSISSTFRNITFPELKLFVFKEKKGKWIQIEKAEKVISNALNLEQKFSLLFQYKINALILKHRLIILWTYHNVIFLKWGGVGGGGCLLIYYWCTGFPFLIDSINFS